MTNQDWENFRTVQRNYFDQVAGTEVIWRKLISNVDRYGEGEAVETTDITLKVITSYNFFRNWPINETTPSGVSDKENFYILINLEYLRDLGLLSPEENLDFDPVHDTFILGGITYYPQGDTPIGQVFASAGYYMVILSRKPISTGDPSR